MQHRRLREAAEHLVGRVDHEVRAGFECVDRQRVVEPEVRSPGLVDEQRDATFVDEIRDRDQVRGHAGLARKLTAHLLARLLHIPQVVQDDDLEAVQLLEQSIQAQFLLGRQELLHQLECRREIDRRAAPQDEFPSQRTEKVRLASSRQTKDQHVLGALDKSALQQRGNCRRTLAGNCPSSRLPSVLPEAVRHWTGLTSRK